MHVSVRRLASQSAIYTLANITARAANYALIPVYAQRLSTAEYGLLGVILAVMNGASYLLMFGLYAAAGRLYFDYAEGPERRTLLGSLYLFLVVVPALLLLAFDRVGAALFSTWLRYVPYDPYLRITLWSAYLSNFSLLPLTIFRNREQPEKVLTLTLGGTVLGVVLTLLFVLVFEQGVLGIIVAGLLTNLIMAGVYSFVLFGLIEFRWKPKQLGAALVYSLPFWPHLMAGWALNLSDRVLLERYVPLALIGVYSLGYQAAQALMVVLASGNQAWAPFFFRSESEGPASAQVPRLASYFVAAMSGLCLAAALGARPVLRLLTPPEYWAAEPITALLALGFLSQAPYYVWANAIMHSKRVAGFPSLMLAAAAVNVGLNFWLIPRWGILAAAINTVIGYAVLAALNFALAQRVYPVRHEYGLWIKVIGLATGVGLIGRWVRLDNVWAEGLSRLALIGLATVVVGRAVWARPAPLAAIGR